MTALARRSWSLLGMGLCIYLGALVVQRYAALPISVGYGAWSWGNAAPIQEQAAPQQAVPVALDTSGDLLLLQHAPTISAAQIDKVLADYGSPAAGTGKDWYGLGRLYNVNPAVAVAFFIHESGAGTNPQWAGWKPDGTSTHNVGNISCAGYTQCYGRFRDYADWHTGIEDWYRLIRDEYISEGRTTVDRVIPKYAPAADNNDEAAYIAAVNSLVRQWAQQAQSAAGGNVPHGHPLAGPLIVTQGYGVGTHAPANVWGGVDYAGNVGDPAYAIIDGEADVSQTLPCGLGVRIRGPRFTTLYCHLSAARVTTGQHVTAGQQVGAVGASGQASGPHLHVEVRDGGVIIDPTTVIQ